MRRIILLILFLGKLSAVKYEPTWESLDARPLPSWYDKAKIGIFIHWGIYSVPSFGSAWFWSKWADGNPGYVKFMEKNYRPGFTYQEFAKDFTAEFFDPDDWAKLFKSSGAKYVVLTSKHHEGFTLWPSSRSFSWNAKDVGPHRDLVKELARAVRAQTDLKFGLYHSLFEWFNPLWVADANNSFRTDLFVQNKVYPELLEIVKNYKPEIVWSDGQAKAPDTYWKSKEFLAWLYNESPVKDTVVTNDRWGSGTACTHGGFYSCKDRYNPGILQTHKWENAMTIDKRSWNHRRNARLEDYMTIHELLVTVAQTVSCGGNILINVGPTKEGTIIPIYREKLLQLGEWLNINGEAIYSSQPWTYQNDTIGTTWYTYKPKTVYAIVLHWPQDNVFKSEKLFELFQSKKVEIFLLGNDDSLGWVLGETFVSIKFPDKATVSSQWVWVLKITEVDSTTNELHIN